MLIHHYWAWSDGSHAATRIVSEAAYARADRVPSLVVRSLPAHPDEEIRLEFRTLTGWELESTSRTDANGVGRLRPYPLCEADRWCRGPLDYRIVAGPETAEITITYLPRS